MRENLTLESEEHEKKERGKGTCKKQTKWDKVKSRRGKTNEKTNTKTVSERIIDVERFRKGGKGRNQTRNCKNNIGTRKSVAEQNNDWQKTKMSEKNKWNIKKEKKHKKIWLKEGKKRKQVNKETQKKTKTIKRRKVKYER